jgi:hypothetical protein
LGLLSGYDDRVKVLAITRSKQRVTSESKAMGKDGKPLAGAAKASFMQKCKRDTCKTKAVGSDGRKLAVPQRQAL